MPSVEFVAATVKEYVPGQYSPSVLVVGIERVVLPAPVPLPGGVGTGLDENEAPDPERPERRREYVVAKAPDKETVNDALVPCGTAVLAGEMETVTGEA